MPEPFAGSTARTMSSVDRWVGARRPERLGPSARFPSHSFYPLEGGFVGGGGGGGGGPLDTEPVGHEQYRDPRVEYGETEEVPRRIASYISDRRQ